MTEKVLTSKVMAYLRTVPDSMWFKVHGSPYQQSGISDIIGLVRGKFVAIELKVGKNRLTALQSRFLAEVRRAWGIGIVAYDVETIKTAFLNANIATKKSLPCVAQPSPAVPRRAPPRRATPR